MEKEEKVDILLATYNSNIEYLKIQIDSILKQTYKNIHLIISDDNSTNKEVIKTIKEYEEQDERVTVYEQKQNLGYIKNFEFLLEKSNSEFISFADHDDFWYENKIEKGVNALKQNNVDLVYSDCKQIDENGKVLNDSYLKYKNMPIINGKNNILAFSRHIAIGCSTIFTKKIKQQMLPFSEKVMAHDWINMYLASKQNGIIAIEEPLFEYRIHTLNQFGGRSLEQNLSRWKKENGSTFASFKKYRNERVIKTAYLNGSLMCKDYRDKVNLEKTEDEENVIKYYNDLLNTKIINLSLGKYKKYLSFENIGKRSIKEKMIFHFPILSFLVFKFK